MKKPDLKKLALMGMAGGLLLSANSLSADNQFSQEGNYGTLLAGHSCGAGGKSCSSYRGNSGSSCGGIADNYDPNGSQETQWQQSSCGGRRPQQQNYNNQQQGYNQPQQGYNYQSQHSCGGSGSGMNQGSQHSCGSSGHGCSTSQSSNRTNAQPYQNPPGNPQSSNWNQNSSSKRYLADADSDTATQTQPPLKESDLLNQLNPDAKATYQTLSPEGKALALKLANQSCKGLNDCKGLGSCKTDDHSCAGKNGCKGQSKCSFKDKNQAVKVAAKKMAEKRNGALKNQ